MVLVSVVLMLTAICAYPNKDTYHTLPALAIRFIFRMRILSGTCLSFPLILMQEVTSIVPCHRGLFLFKKGKSPIKVQEA